MQELKCDHCGIAFDGRARPVTLHFMGRWLGKEPPPDRVMHATCAPLYSGVNWRKEKKHDASD